MNRTEVSARAGGPSTLAPHLSAELELGREGIFQVTCEQRPEGEGLGSRTRQREKKDPQQGLQ